MKHITPQAQNHIFKERKGRKPVPFKEGNSGETAFITLDELKIFEKRGKNIMDSDSDSDESFVDANTNDKNTETNDDTLTIDEKETNYEEEDELFEEDHGDEKNEENEENEELELKPKGFTVKKTVKKKQKKLSFTMNYDEVKDEW